MQVQNLYTTNMNHSKRQVESTTVWNQHGGNSGDRNHAKRTVQTVRQTQIIVSFMHLWKKHQDSFTTGLTDQCPNRVFIYGFPSLVSNPVLYFVATSHKYNFSMIRLWNMKKNNCRHRRHLNFPLSISTNIAKPSRKIQSTRIYSTAVRC